MLKGGRWIPALVDLDARLRERFLLKCAMRNHYRFLTKEKDFHSLPQQIIIVFFRKVWWSGNKHKLGFRKSIPILAPLFLCHLGQPHHKGESKGENQSYIRRCPISHSGYSRIGVGKLLYLCKQSCTHCPFTRGLARNSGKTSNSDRDYMTCKV